MISEKTVELNLTTELVNWLGWVTKKVHFALAPSQQAEGHLGFDVSVAAPGDVGILLQYKRAYVTGSIWTWKLNRTKCRDQHQRLQQLEAVGLPVFYGLPHFHTVSDLVRMRRRLLNATFWFPPSFIQPSGGSTGYHDVTFDSASGAWAVRSEHGGTVRPPSTARALADALDDRGEQGSLSHLLAQANEILGLSDQQSREMAELVDVPGQDPSIVAGLSALGRSVRPSSEF